MVFQWHKIIQQQRENAPYGADNKRYCNQADGLIKPMRYK